MRRAWLLLLWATSAIASDRIYIPMPRFKQGLAAVQVGDSWGYIDRSGRIVVPPRYSEAAEPCDDGTLIVDGSLLLDRQGRVLLAAKRPLWTCFAFGLAMTDPMTSFIGRDGKERFSLGMYGRGFSEGLAAIEVDGKWGYVRPDGTFAVAPRFDDARSFSEGLAAVAAAAHQYGLIDERGEWVIAPEWTFISDFREGRVAVNHGIDAFYLDRGGRRIAGPFRVAHDFSGGLAGVCRELCGYIDRSGRVVIPLRFEHVRDFAAGLAPAKLDGRWGYIDRRGRWVIDPRFAEAEEFSEGLAAVDFDESVDERDVGYIDRRGMVVIRVREVAERFARDQETARLERVKAESVPWTDPLDPVPADVLLARVFREGDASALPALLRKMPATAIAERIAAMPREIQSDPFHVVTVATLPERKGLGRIVGPVRDRDGGVHLAFEATPLNEATNVLHARRDANGWALTELRGGARVLGLIASPAGTVHLFETTDFRRRLTERRWDRDRGWSEPRLLLPEDERNGFADVAIDDDGTISVLFFHGDELHLVSIDATGVSDAALPITRQDSPNPWFGPNGGARRIYLERYDDTTEEDLTIVDVIQREGGSWSKPRRIVSTAAEVFLASRDEALLVDFQECGSAGTATLCLAGIPSESRHHYTFVEHDGATYGAISTGESLLLGKRSEGGLSVVQIAVGERVESPRLLVGEGEALVAFVDRSDQKIAFRVVSVPLDGLEWSPWPAALSRFMAGRPFSRWTVQVITAMVSEAAWQLERGHHAPAALELYGILHRAPFSRQMPQRLCETFREAPQCRP